MKKNIVRFRTVLLLLLIACTCVFPTTAHATDSISTEQMIIPPTAEEAAAAVQASSYSSPPIYIFPFVFDGTDSIIWTDLDTSNFVVGRLYVHNENTGSVTEITENPVVRYTTTSEHLYYVTDDDKIYQTNFVGSFHTPLYQATQGNITYLDYYNGCLTFIEGGVQVKILDISSQIAATVFANENLSSVYFFDKDKFIWRDRTGQPFYYNITTRNTVTFNNEHEANCVVAPYITPAVTEESQAEIMANTNTYNDVTMPFSNYPATMATYNGYSGYPTALSYFTGGYAGSNQCDGFAKYAFDRYSHISDPGGAPSFVYNDQHWYSTSSPATCTGVLGEADENGVTRLRRIVTSVDTGAFIRFGKIRNTGECKEQHSGVISTVNSNGFWLYECNNDDQCGVFYTFYTYEQMISKYHCVKYYVDHNFSQSYSLDSKDRHKVPCLNCAGYTLPEHTGTANNTLLSTSSHTIDYSCCSGTTTGSHTGTKTCTLFNLSRHTVDYSCCSGTTTELHTGTKSNTILSATKHGTGYSCCSGTSSESHSGTKYHYTYNDTHHKIVFSCCSGFITETHTYSGSNPECTKCGYSPALGYSIKDEQEQ